MSQTDSIKRLLSPKSVAVFGGSDAEIVIEKCRAAGFNGELWAVNPRRDHLAGVPCFKTVAELPHAPDASFIAAPPEATIEIVEQLGARGAGGAVCYASGFAETGEQGADRQNRLRAAAGNMATMGPNCHGFVNYMDNVALWPDEHGGHSVDSGVALIMQSGNLGINLSMQRRGFDLGLVITLGNSGAQDMHKYVDALLDDERVSVIGLHIEGIADVRAFSKVAIKALRCRKPLVAIKSGRSSKGADINLSHTASLSGSDRIYDAFFRRVGIARCATLTQFLETLKFLSIAGVLDRATFGSMSCSGGEAALIADYSASIGLSSPALSVESADALQEILGPTVSVSNPLDYHTYIWGNYEKLLASFRQMLSNRFACTMLVLDYPTGGPDATKNWQVAEKALTVAATETGEVAVIVSTLPETLPAETRDRLRAAGIAPMQGLEDCLYAISAAALIGASQGRLDEIQPVFAGGLPEYDTESFDEMRSKRELASYGITLPNGRECSAAEASVVASEIGFPVVVKILSADIAHKSDVGGVIVNLSSDDEIVAAVDGMSGVSKRFLIEEMISPIAFELIVGASRDPTFGLTLLVGAGGTLVELLDDSATLLLPASRSEIQSAFEGLKIARLATNYRGQSAADIGTIVDAIAAVAEYVADHRNDLVELDINPLAVTSDRVVAVDAMVRISNDRAGQP